MDSGNSGSLQSSSGVGEEELDSRCGGSVDSSPLSALLRQSASPSLSSSGFGATFYGLQELEASTPLPPLPQVVHHWSAALQASDQASTSSSSSHGLPVSADTAAPAQPALPTPPRGSRKRTRASRRAPTTVLATDTSNFRAMVQEFTGIPSPPFAGAPVRSRFDQLFPSPSSLRSSAAAANPAASFPPYLLRPFEQKHQPAPFPSFALASTSSPAQSSTGTAPPTACSRTTAMVSGDSYRYYLLAPDPPPVGRVRSGNCLSFQSPIGLQLGGGAMHPMSLDAAGRGLVPSVPSQRLKDPADFLGITHGFLGSEGDALAVEVSNPHNRDHYCHREDELSGLVVSGVCTTTYSDVAGEAPPLLERNAGSTSGGVAATTTTARATAAMRTQGVDAWICTSD
ncbi:hypothetical protein ACQ4PT_019843 [Festuca glaucescens]